MKSVRRPSFLLVIIALLAAAIIAAVCARRSGGPAEDGVKDATRYSRSSVSQ